MPTPSRNPSAIAVNREGELMLFDCGEGTQRQFKIAGLKPTKIGKIFITHWHGDHVLGLPGLIQTMSASDYSSTLRVFGPAGIKEKFSKMMDATRT